MILGRAKQDINWTNRTWHLTPETGQAMPAEGRDCKGARAQRKN